MDINLIIIIVGVFCASLFSLLIINKFFRRKTFEDIIAEKRALSAGLKAQSALGKKPKKLQQLKKEQKREKKQRQKETKQQMKDQNDEDSDSVQHNNNEEDDSEPKGLSKVHVEFEPDPEIVTYNAAETKVKATTNLGDKKAAKKDKKSQKSSPGAGAASGGGILINKHEPVAVKESLAGDESPAANTFEIKQPKDIVELKKEKEKKEDKSPNRAQAGNTQTQTQPQKKEKSGHKKETNNNTNVMNTAGAANAIVNVAANHSISSPSQLAVEASIQVAKEAKQNASNPANSPKNQPKSLSKQTQKKQQKESAQTKELMSTIEKLNEGDTVGVQLLMNLFRKADLNRSEIQLLIDYLLNKQQDMPAMHSEWSDDVCAKLKRQLQEKEKALIEAQEATVGMHAKLRELRTEVNNERLQLAATTKSCNDKLAAKDHELAILGQELQALNEKFTLERQQLQAKALQDKQASNDLMKQIQLLQNDLAHKEHCYNELMLTASQKSGEEMQEKDDLINKQIQQIATLEQQRMELEDALNNHVFEEEKVKSLELENSEYKIEVGTLNNALATANQETALLQQELNALKAKQQDIENLTQQNALLQKQIEEIQMKTNEQNNKESSLQVTLDSMQKHLQDKEQMVKELTQTKDSLSQKLTALEEAKAQENQKLNGELEAVKKNLAEKAQLLEDNKQAFESLKTKETALARQVEDLKQRNDEQQAMLSAVQKPVSANMSTNTEKLMASPVKNTLTTTTTTITSLTHSKNSEEDKIREILERLYPEAVKACANTALSVSFEQWVDQVLKKCAEQKLKMFNSSSSDSNHNNTNNSNKNNNHSNNSDNSNNNKSTQSNSNHFTTSVSTNTTSDDVAALDATNNGNGNGNGRLNTSSSSSDLYNDSCRSSSSHSGHHDAANDSEEVQRLYTQNLQLRAQIDSLTNLVTKTSNTLSDLESRAREQEEYWKNLVQSKEDLIVSLQHTNGEQEI